VNLDPDHCYQALCARDRRFDGAFFVAVASTGIYCRPICPAKTPGRARCRFYRHAAEAERDGYRACLRCRPELAPGRASVDAIQSLVGRAVRAIELHAKDEPLDVESLAARLGSSARHVRRAMQAELGLSPIQLDQSRRLALAKQLLHDSPLSIAEIAFASGFGSVRRFNDAFLARCGMSPSRIRKDGARARTGSFPLRLDFRPPFDWDALLAFLSVRAIPGVEQVEGGRYLRTVALGGARGWLSAEMGTGYFSGTKAACPHFLRVTLSDSLAPVVRPVVARLRRLFDLDAEPARIAEHLGPDPLLGPGIARRPGLRVPGAFDGFELGVRAILGQQVSVRGASTLSGRLVARFGTPLPTPWPALTHAFPEPRVLAETGETPLAQVGMPGARARSIQGLAKAVAGGLALEPGGDVEATCAALVALPGIGEWTAQYVAMRALRWPDAFPHGDLVLRKALGGLPPKALLARTEPWRPWRAYAAMHLWASA
jgi:AraC family transcriptional regulator of adaptative response / DNA-3-methyladenine glycosylase II